MNSFPACSVHRYRTQPPHDKPYWFQRPTGEATGKDPAVTPPEDLDIDDGKPGKTWQSFKAFFGFGSPEGEPAATTETASAPNAAAGTDNTSDRQNVADKASGSKVKQGQGQ